MIDVMKRLAELDASNPRVEKTVIKQELNGENAVTGLNKYTGDEVFESISVQELQKLSGLTESIAECGPMGMPGMVNKPPASFNIMASAADGHEVAAMLGDILNLAGVKEVGPKDIGADEPMHHGDALTGEPPAHGGDDIKAAIDAIDRAEMDDEAMVDPMGADAMGMEPSSAADVTGEPGDVGDMADEVRGMADELSGTSKEELGLESLRMFDNSPEETTRAYDPNDFAQVVNKIRDFETVPARGGDNPLKAHATEAVKTTDDTGSLAEQLMADYQAFANEGKVTELSKDTLKSYNDKATNDVAKRITGDDKDLKKIGDRQKGYERASKRGVK